MKNRAAIDTEKLVEIREERMSRVELAARVQYGEKQIYNLETGKGRVSERLINAVCGVLEIDRDEIEVRPRKGERREGTHVRRRQALS